MHNVSKLTIQGKVTIPKRVRDELGVTPGDVIVFTKKGSDIVIKPASTLLDLKGVIVAPKKIKDWASVRKSVKKSVAKRVMEGLE